MERLTALDAGLLEAEDFDPRVSLGNLVMSTKETV